MKFEKEHSELNWIIAAGVVGADIGTSVFYGTGILFPIVGYFCPSLHPHRLPGHVDL